MADKMKSKIITYKYPLISSLITALLTYMFAFTNKLPNHDDVSQMFSKGVTIESGRWGLELTKFIFPNFSMPWIYGIISIAFIAVAACLIISIFEIENKLFQTLLSALIISFPSLIGTFTYMFTSCSFAVSFLLAVLAVFFLVKKRTYYIVLSVICMVFSMGIYQSYISLAVGLLLVYLVKELFDNNSVVKDVFIKGCVFLGFIIVSVGLYYLITRIVLFVSGTGFGEYAQHHLNSQNETVVLKIKIVYSVFLDVFIRGTHGLIPCAFSKVLHILFAVFIVIIKMLN